MNDLEDRLTRHLRDTADLAQPAPNVIAVIHEMPRPGIDRPARGRSWVPAAAAAALVVVGGVGLAVLNDSRAPSTANQPSAPTAQSATADPETTTPSTANSVGTTPDQTAIPSPSALTPTAFPVLDKLPDGLSATGYVQQMAEGWTGSTTEALIGRRVDDVLTDAIQITMQSQPIDINPMKDRTPTETSVMGQPASVYDYSNPGQPQFVVTWGAGPYFVAIGESPLAFLVDAYPDTFRTSVASNDDPPQLTIGPLPDGFEVVAEPQTLRGKATMSATLSIGADNYDISVSTRNRLIDMATAGPLRSIAVDGHPAWTYVSSERPPNISWQVDDSTFVFLKVNDATTAADALTLANNITFVDFDTWTARYSPDTVDETATSEPTGN